MGFMFFSDEFRAMFFIVATLLLFTWITMCLRIYVRGFLKKNWGWDDVFAVITLVTYTTTAGLLLSILPQKDLAAFTSDLKRFSEIIFSVSALYIITMVFFKISLAIFVLRFLQETWQRRVVKGAAAVATIVGIAFFIFLHFQCGSPSSMLANQLAQKCGPWRILGPFNYLYAGLTILTDWTFALIPIFAIRRINIPRRAKISASVLLGLGGVASIASIIRMFYIEDLDVNRHLFPSSAIGTISAIELGLGQIASHCATLRPLFSRYLERIEDSMSKSEGNPSQNGPAEDFEPWVLEGGTFGSRTESGGDSLSGPASSGDVSEAKQSGPKSVMVMKFPHDIPLSEDEQWFMQQREERQQEQEEEQQQQQQQRQKIEPVEPRPDMRKSRQSMFYRLSFMAFNPSSMFKRVDES